MSARAGKKRKPEDSATHSVLKKAKPDAKPGSTSSQPTSSPDLKTLLDCTGLSSDEQIVLRFDAISKALLHDYLLVVTRTDGSTTRLQVLEHEFYFQKAGLHEDPFAHGAEEQKVLGRWYFHRAPRKSEDSNRSSTSLTGYRGGSRKGLDLTFGRPGVPSGDDPLLRGGILLRSVCVLGDVPKVVSGPSLLVDQVLSLSGASDIRELVEQKWQGDISAFTSQRAGVSLRVVSKATLGLTSTSIPSIFKSPRIGLDLSHPGTTSPKIKPLHSRIQFLPRQYRFFVKPDELVANGRIQTFVGLISHFAAGYKDLDAALDNMKLVGDICRTMGLKENTAKKYLADYKDGREGGLDLLAGFIGPKGKGASSSPASYLTMMGALSAVDSL